MELCKQSLLSLQLFTEPLAKNFTLIEDQFKRINDTIAALREENETFKNFRKTVEKLIENNQVNQQGLRPRISKQQLAQNCQDHMEGNVKAIENVSDGIKLSETNIAQNDLNEQKRNAESISLISEQEISSTILNDASNLPQMNKITSLAASLKDSKPTSRQQNHQNGKKQIPADSSQSNKVGQNRTVAQQILQLKQRLEGLEAHQVAVRQQIQALEKENQKFKKMLGIKKSVIKQKTITQSNQTRSKKVLTSFSKKSIQSQANLQAQTQKSNMGDQSLKEDDEQGNDFGCFKELKDDIEKIRDYLSGKMRAIDTNFAEVNIKINGIERSLDILERTDNSLKEDIEYLEKTANETKLNMTELHEKSVQLTKSRFNKNLNTSNNSLCEQIQKDELEIQERIIHLLDQMEQLKEEYNEILFGKGESDGKQKQLDPEMAEKRKKLAQKLNSSQISDQKLRKDLTHCKRDLKKLRQEFDYLLNGVNTGTNEIKTLIIKPNQTKQDWKSLSTKINKFKQELQSQIKQLEGKITANNQLTVVLNEFEVGIEECKILLKKKLDITDFDKTTKRIQNRLNNFIRQTFEKEGYTNEQDAILAKQPWFCLSCDVELKTYSGKMNKQSPVQTNSGEKFVGKKVNPESHMVRRNENGRLPSIAI